VITNFNLEGSAIVELNTDPTMGHVAVNSIFIDHGVPGIQDTSSWEGMYFKGIPITIKAVPLPGFQFVRWETNSSIDPNSQVLELVPEADTSITAVFEPLN
jgi:hypothetical protein